MECKIPHYINQKGQISLTHEPARCKFQSVCPISPYQSHRKSNTPLQQSAEYQPLVPEQRPLLEPRLRVPVADSHPSPLKATFSSSGPLPNIFILTQYLLLLGKPTGCHQRALVCSPYLELVKGKRQTNREREEGGLHQCQVALQCQFLLNSK